MPEPVPPQPCATPGCGHDAAIHKVVGKTLAEAHYTVCESGHGPRGVVCPCKRYTAPESAS